MIYQLESITYDGGIFDDKNLSLARTLLQSRKRVGEKRTQSNQRPHPPVK
jgi:hypothetical protein